MTRPLIAAAAALLAAPALFASAAQACISCNYTPEVVKGSLTSDAPRHYAKPRYYSVEREHTPRVTKKRIIVREVVREPVVKKPVETAATTPDTKPAKSENSSISAAADVAAVEPAKVETKPAKSENSSISVASTEAAAPEKATSAEPAKETANKAVDCKQFFPSVGLTLSVPCE